MSHNGLPPDRGYRKRALDQIVLDLDRRDVGEFGDPGASARFATPHTAKREQPIYRDGPAGPWHGRVEVTPVVMRRGVAFEVRAEWGGHGQPVPGLGPTARPSSAAADIAVVNTAEHGRGLAIRALELLAAGERPGEDGGLARLAVELLGRDALYRA